MLQQVLSQALRKEHREAGLYLDEEDDHFLYLKRDGKRLAAFHAPTVTVVAILNEADKHLQDRNDKAEVPA